MVTLAKRKPAIEVIGFDEDRSAVYATMYKTRRGDHRYFVKRNGDLVIADNSAYWPDETDDGELYPRLDLPIVVSIDDSDGDFWQNLRMQCSRPNKDDSYVTITVPDALFLSATFGIAIEWRGTTYKVTET